MSLQLSCNPPVSLKAAELLQAGMHCSTVTVQQQTQSNHYSPISRASHFLHYTAVLQELTIWLIQVLC